MKHIGSIGIVIGFVSLIMAPVVTAETSASNQPKPPVSTPQKPETTDPGTGTTSQTIPEQIRRSLRSQERREVEDDHSP